MQHSLFVVAKKIKQQNIKIDSLFCNLQSDSQFWPALRVDAKFSDAKSVQTTCIYYCISKERPNNALQFRGLIMAVSSGF